MINFREVKNTMSKYVYMGDPKENAGRSFGVKERMQEDRLEDSRPVMTEEDFQYAGDKRNEQSYALQLNMGKTKEEFEILYTRL